MANQTETRKRVLAIGAHDDDVIIGIGGTLLLRHQNEDVEVVVMTNGQNSHVVVLGVSQCPGPAEVAQAREKELHRAYGDLGCLNGGIKCHVNQWEYPDTCGVLTFEKTHVKQRLDGILSVYQPDIIYFQAPDAHEDHRLAHHAMMEVLQETNFHGEAYLYAIWTRELALMRPEVDASLIEDFPGKVEVVDVRKFLHIKRRALHRFTSQVQLWPYPDWQPQEKPILDAGFLNYFLRGEEIISRIK